ncbi:hypothetical protein [Nocardiopsis alkaliphila]|uniref:hypothetical protein n=1 Tax=Nocardiopsis alkaliphila TaxID=225762 RepID=UPI00036ED1E9
MSKSPPCRPLRAGVFTLVCASLSAIGHAVGSGHEVPLFGLLLGGVVIGAMAWAGSLRRMGVGALAARMLWGQLALHVTFSVTQGWNADHGEHMAALAPEPMPAGVMITMHVAMALVSAWWLKLGEDLLFAFLRFMGASLAPLLPVSKAVPEPTAVTAPRFVPVHGPSCAGVLCLRHTRVLRGPPPVFAA